jgi:hypothetical protein
MLIRLLHRLRAWRSRPLSGRPNMIEAELLRGRTENRHDD